MAQGRGMGMGGDDVDDFPGFGVAQPGCEKGISAFGRDFV